MNYYTNKCTITLFDIKYFYDHTDNNAKSSHLPLLIVIKNMLYSLLKHSSSCGHCIYLLRLTLIHCIAYSMISKTKSTCYLYGKIVESQMEQFFLFTGNFHKKGNNYSFRGTPLFSFLLELSEFHCTHHHTSTMLLYEIRGLFVEKLYCSI